MKFFRSKQQKDKKMDEAATLFIHLHDNNASPDDWQAYQKWKAGSITNTEIIEGIEDFWSSMDAINELPWPTPDDFSKDDYNGTLPIPLPVKTAFYSSKNILNTCVYHLKSAPLTFSLVAIIVIALIYWQFPTAKLNLNQATYDTAVAEHKLVALEDGSELFLGGHSSIKINYSDSYRKVFLNNGEVLFTVAKDPDRPFIVSVDEIDVVAVGTQFNISKVPDEIIISVTEGIVRVISSSDNKQTDTNIAHEFNDTNYVAKDPTALMTGQQIRYNDRGEPGLVQEMNSEEIVSWRDGRLVYTGEPLRSVIADINRYYHYEIKITDAEISDMLFSGTVRKDSIKEWLYGLETAFPVSLYSSGRTLFLTKRSLD